MSAFKLRIVAIVAVAMLCACGGATYFQQSRDKNHKLAELAEKEMNVPDFNSVSGHYLSAALAKYNGEPKQALSHLNEAIGMGYNDNELYVDGYALALNAGDIELAAQFASKIESSNEAVILSPKLIEAVVAIRKGDLDKASAFLKQAPENGFGLIVVSLLEAWVSQAQNKSYSVEPLKALITPGGEFEMLIKYQLALLEDSKGTQNNSYYDDLLKARYLPHHVAWMVGNHYKRIQNKEKFSILQKRYEADVALQLNYNTPPPEKLDYKQGSAEVFFGIASVLIAIDAIEVAQIPLNLASYLNKDFIAVDFIRAQINEKISENNLAIEGYKALQNDEVYGDMANLQLAYLYQKENHVDDALAQIDSLLARDPNNLEMWLAKGDILRNEERYKESIEAYSAGIDSIKDKKATDWPAFYSRAISYERDGNWKMAENDFLEALRLQPDQPDVLNYLGYSWLVQNRQLNQAKAMIEKAIKARPRDAHIIDSMGWALYLLGDYDNSLKYLERAVYLSPVDATVNEHLGDAYWRAGYQLQAKYQWERALTFNPVEKGQEQSIKDKIANGLEALDDTQNLPQNAEASKEQRADVLLKNKKQPIIAD